MVSVIHANNINMRSWSSNIVNNMHTPVNNIIILDSGCSQSMFSNITYLSYFVYLLCRVAGYHRSGKIKLREKVEKF